MRSRCRNFRGQIDSLQLLTAVNSCQLPQNSVNESLDRADVTTDTGYSNKGISSNEITEPTSVCNDYTTYSIEKRSPNIQSSDLIVDDELNEHEDSPVSLWSAERNPGELYTNTSVMMEIVGGEHTSYRISDSRDAISEVAFLPKAINKSDSIASIATLSGMILNASVLEREKYTTWTQWLPLLDRQCTSSRDHHSVTGLDANPLVVFDCGNATLPPCLRSVCGSGRTSASSLSAADSSSSAMSFNVALDLPSKSHERSFEVKHLIGTGSFGYTTLAVVKGWDSMVTQSMTSKADILSEASTIKNIRKLPLSSPRMLELTPAENRGKENMSPTERKKNQSSISSGIYSDDPPHAVADGCSRYEALKVDKDHAFVVWEALIHDKVSA